VMDRWVMKWPGPVRCRCRSPTGGADDGAGADFPGLAAAWLVEAVAFGDGEGLPDGVRVPSGAGRGGEADGADTDV
jgi:hypothetical protein